MPQNKDPFHAIADSTRRQILILLNQKSHPINSLVENFNMSRPAISKHIKVLYEGGLINIEEKGRERYCTLNIEGFKKLQEWMNYFDKFWSTKLDTLETLFKEKTKNK